MKITRKIQSKIMRKISPKIGGISQSYSKDLALLWNAGSGLRSLVGPNCTFASSGSVASGLSDGSLLPQNTLPVRTDSYGRKFVGNEPAYSNLVGAASVETALDASVTVSTNTGITTVTEVGNNSVLRVCFKGSITFASGSVYTVSRRVKQVGRRYVQLTGPSSIFGSIQYANFDLQSGVITASDACTARINALDSDGYWLISITLTATGSGSAIACGIVSLASGSDLRAPLVAGIDGIAYLTKQAMCVQSAYQMTYIAPGTSATSTAGTTGGNGQQWPMLSSDVKGNKLLEAFRGVPDGVELYKTTGWTLYYATKTGDSFAINATVSNVAASLLDLVTPTIPSGERCLVTYEVYDYVSGSVSVNLHDNSGGNIAGTARGSAGIYTEEMILTCEFDSINIQARLGSGFVGKIRDISIQKLTGAVMTVACLVRKGVSSAELPNNTWMLYLDCSNSGNLIHNQTYGSNLNNLRSNDGTSAVTLSLPGWNRYEWHYLIVQTNSTGTQYRIGCQRLTEAMVPIGTDQITWGSWTTFDGSFNPLSALISALNTPAPNGLAHLQVWRKQASDAEIVREIRRKYPIGA